MEMQSVKKFNMKYLNLPRPLIFIEIYYRKALVMVNYREMSIRIQNGNSCFNYAIL